MAKLTSNEFAERWSRRLSSVTDDIAKGVDRVTQAPGAAAAAKKDKWIAKMTDANVQARWAKNIGAYPLDQWKADMKNYGISRIPSGTEKAKSKMEQFASQLLAYQDASLSKIRSMRDVTREDMKARMTAWFDVMSKFEFKR